MSTGTPTPNTPVSPPRHKDGADAAADVLARCVTCGYDLRGFDDARLCPECGGNVGASKRERLRREERFGPSMRLRGEPRWFWTLGIGFVLHVIGTLMWVAVTGHGRRTPGGKYVTAVWILLLLNDLVLWFAAWLISARPRVERRHATLLRLTFRALVTLWMLSHGAFLVSRIANPNAMPAWEEHATIVRCWAAALSTVVGFGCLANIAARLDFFSVRRICIGMSAAALLLVYAAIQKGTGTGTPNIAGVALPMPLHPILGSIDVHLDLSRMVLIPESWPHLWKHSLAGVVWLVSSLSTLTWFALAVLLQANKPPSEDA